MTETTLSASQKNVKAIFVWILGFGVLFGVAGSAFAGEIRDHRGPGSVRDHRADPKGPTGYTFCAKKGERCQFRGIMDVAYGAYGLGPQPYGGYELNIPLFAYKHGISGGIDCNVNTFGDPFPNRGNAGYFVEACYIKQSIRDHRAPVPAAGPTGWTFCAYPGRRCEFSGTADVAFGAHGWFRYKRGVNGIDCNVGIFGEPIPQHNVKGVQEKDYACYMNPIPSPSLPS